MSISNEDYLNGLIAKAKKSWEGVDVDSYMSDLRDEEGAEKEQKAIDEEVRLKKCDDMTEAEYNRETAFVDWYLENGKGMPAYSDAIEWARKDLLAKVCVWLDRYLHLFVMKGHINHDALEQEFRKAMEE